MPSLQTIIQENKKERERLRDVVSALKESDFTRTLPNGWTVGVALAHLAFWDLRAAWLVEKWLHDGGRGPVLPLDADAVNAPLAILSAAIPTAEVANLVQQAAERADGVVKTMTQEQVDEFLMAGSERFLRRCLHRQHHLDRIEEAIRP